MSDKETGRAVAALPTLGGRWYLRVPMRSPMSIAKRVGPLAVGVLLTLLVAPPARADDTNAPARKEAAQKFAEGMTAFRGEDYRRAADAFDAAYALGPHYDVLWNAARAWESAGEPTRAANRYAKYLREAPPDARDRGRANVALAQLAKKLGRLELNVPPSDDVRIDGERASERIVYVTPGSHVVMVQTSPDGREEHIDVNVSAGSSLSVAPKRAARAAAELGPPPPAAASATPTSTSAEPVTAKRWSPAVVYVGGGLSLAAAGFLVASGLDTLDAKTTFNREPSQRNLDAGEDKQLRTNVLVGVTTVLSLATIACAVYLVDWSGGKGQARVGVNEAGLGLSGRFE